VVVVVVTAASPVLEDEDEYMLTAREDFVDVSLKMRAKTVNITARHDADFRTEVHSQLTVAGFDDMETTRIVEALMHKGAGDMCASCKIAVEEIAFQIDNLRERLNNMMPQLLRMEELENGVDITSNLMSREYGLLCKQSGYRQGKYSSAVMQGCLLVLQSNEFQMVLADFGDMDPKDLSWVPRFKRKLCTLETELCSRKRTPPDHHMSPCRLCAETMQDLIYILRRAPRNGFFRAKGTKKVKVKFLGSFHIRTAMQELCSSTNLRHGVSVASDLEEKCESMLEFEEELHALLNRNLSMSSSRSMCVDLIQDCTHGEFDGIVPQLENAHFIPFSEVGNISSAKFYAQESELYASTHEEL